MRLICPSCGATHSADAFNNDAAMRDVVAAISQLPGPVASRALGYLALFRPGKSALSWKRAGSLLRGLSELVKSPTICASGASSPARANSPAFWAQGMDTITERRPQTLPLKNHNYLRAVVYDIANQADKDSEKYKNASERNHSLRPKQGPDQRNAAPERISPELMKAIREKNLPGRRKKQGETNHAR
jgi:hypothetical protein